MYKAGIRPHIIDRVMARLGRLHWIDTLDPKRTALVGCATSAPRTTY